MNHTHFQTTHNPFCFLLFLCHLLLTPLSAWAAVLAYVPNYSSSSVSVIDTATNTVIATVPVGYYPSDAAITPDGKWVYVTNQGTGLGTVSVINTSNNTISNSISVGLMPSGVAITPDGTKAYVAEVGSNSVFVVNTSNNTVSYTIDVGEFPYGVAVTPNGTKVYVTNSVTFNVSVIDTDAVDAVDAVIATVPVGHFSRGVVATNNNKIYVVNDESGYNINGTVSVINTLTNAVLNTVTVGNMPYGITATPDDTKVYVANSGSNSVSVIRTIDNTVIETVTIGIGSFPNGIAATPDGKKVYVINSGDDTISVIDTTTDAVVGSPIVVGDYPSALGQFIGDVKAPRYDSTPVHPVIPPTTPNTISFSTTVSTSVTQNLTAQNIGEAPLNITSIDLNDTTGQFSVDTTPFSLPISGTKTLTISCAGSTAGVHNAQLTIGHNAMNSPATYTLSCTVNAAPTPGYTSLPAAGSTLSFIATAPANSTVQTLTIQETGTAQLDVTSLSIGGSHPGKFIISPVLPSTFNIADGGADKGFDIQCDGSTVGGPYTATLTATHNATGSPATYNLSCTVSATPTAAYTSTPSSFGFTTTAFTNPSPQTLTVQNTGTATLNVTSIAITGAGTAKFTAIPTTFNINSGGTQNVTISCDGSTAGTYAATLTVTHNTGSPASYPLSCIVDKLDTNITLDSHDPDTSAVGQTVPFFFIVSPSTATGSVNVVKDGTTVLCTGTLTSGIGSCTHRFTAIGDYLLTAEYVSSTNYNGSFSSDVIYTVIDGSILFSTNTTDLLEGQEDAYAYTLELPTNPTSPIEITLKADAQTEISLDGIDYAPTQILSLTDTTAQTVYVRAIDDTQTEGNHTGKVTHTITQSTDTGYPTALKIPAFTVNITDNEAGVVITPTSLTVTEGRTAIYAIKLASQPLNDVTISVMPGNNQVQVTPTSRTFLADASADASALNPQTVMVTAIDDQAVEGAHKATLTHVIMTGDGGDYEALTLDAVTVNVNDNDSSTATPPPSLPSDNQNADNSTSPPPDNTPPQLIATLFVTVDGDDKGRVESSLGGISCSNYDTGTCQATFPPGTEITLKPIADPGFTFSSWGGHVDCTDNKVLMMADNKLCVAFFAPLPPSILPVTPEATTAPSSPPSPVPETPTPPPIPATVDTNSPPTETPPVETVPMTPASIETTSSSIDTVPPVPAPEIETAPSPLPPTETVQPVPTPVAEEVTSPPVVTPVEVIPEVSTIPPFQPIVVYPTGEGWCPPKDWLDWECNAQWRTIDSDLDIEIGGQLSSAIVEGKIDNQGWVYNLIIQPQSTLFGGVVSGYITNYGKMSDFEFRGYSIVGGTLSGTIFNNSSVGGYFQDVQLTPHTHIVGGKLKGKITGDVKAPALLENVNIQAGSHLSGVILGKGVKVSKQVTLDEDVRVEMTDK